MTKVVDTLLNWPIVKDVLDKIAKWLDDFASFLEKDSTIKALEAFGKFFSETLKLEFLLFTGQFTKLVDEIKSLIPSINALMGSVWDWLKGKLPKAQYDPSADPFAIPGTASPYTPGQQGAIESPSKFASASTPTAMPTSFASNNRTSYSMASLGGDRTGNVMQRFTDGGARMASLRSPGGGGGGYGPASPFAMAANRAVPGQDARGYALNAQMAMLGGGSAPAPRRGRGAQDIDNWQMNRYASLVVRDVPSANIYMNGAGMAA
jgi:hypothetical protein